MVVVLVISFELWELAKNIVGEVPQHYSFVYFIVAVFLSIALVFILISPLLLLNKLIGGR